MLREFRGGAYRRALTSVFLASTALAASIAPAFATDYTVTGTDTTAKTLSGSDTLTVSTSSDSLAVSGTAINWTNNTGTGVIVYNYGTISGTTRAIDSSSSASTRSLSLYNYDGATVLGTGNDAFRINAALTGGTITVDNAGDIKSTGGQALDFAAIVSGNVVVNITNRTGGTIESTADDAIRPGAGTIDIDNSGTIRADASGSRAINVNNAAVIASFTLTNNAGADIESDDDAVRISSTPTSVGNIIIDNAGTIQTLGTAGGQAIDLDGVNHAIGMTTSITNELTGVISSTNADAVRPGSNATVYNYGSITAGSTDTTGGYLNDGSSDGIDFQAHDGTVVNGAVDNTTASITGARHGITTGLGQTVTVTNYGSITGSNGSGVGSDGYGTVTNYGTITGTANLDYCTSDPDCFGDGDGVDIDYSATIYNYGTIQGTGSVGIKPGETDPSHSEGLALGGGTVVNGDATHASALISGADYGITVDDSNGGDAYAATSITNYGTIQGLNGYAIRLADDAGTYSNTISNYGTISGTTFAVEMGNGDDTFNDYGGTVSGLVDAQGGSDTLNIDRGLGTSYAFDGTQWTNFETTDVVSGTVTLSGDYTSSTAFNVYLGSAFIGSGKVTTGLFENAGTLQAGTASAVGTLAIAGDFANTSGSTYVVKIDGTSSDLLDITGTATLNGGTVSVVSLSDLNHHTYTILSAAGGVTGTFGTLDLSPFVEASLDYTDPNAVTLTVDPVANTQGGSGVANALNTAGTDLGLGSLPANEVPGALNDLAPNSPGSDTTGGAVTSFAFSSQVNQHIASLQSDIASEHGTTRLAMAGDEAGDLLASLVGGATVSPAASSGLWLRSFGLAGNLDAQSGQMNGLSYKGGGVEGGYDHFIGERTLVGLSAGYARVVNDPDRAGASSDVTSYAFGLYAATMMGSYDLAGQFGFIHNAYHESRYITFAGETASADYDGNTFSANAELGRTFTSGTLALRPAAGLDMMRLTVDDYTETGAPGYNLTGASQSSNLVRSTLGASASFDGGAVSPSLDLRWGHDFKQADGALSYAFAGLANSGFLVDRNTPARDALLVGAGIDAKLAEMIDLSLAGSADLRSNAQGYGLSLKLRCNW